MGGWKIMGGWKYGKMENQTTRQKVIKKKLLNNVTEEPNLQTKQSGIKVLDFCLKVRGRYSEE